MLQATAGSSPFLKRVLVPFWVVRLAILATNIVLYAIAIDFFRATSDRTYVLGHTSPLAALSTLEALFVVCMLLDFVCIIKRACRTLSPTFFFATNLIQTTIFTVLFILSILSGLTLTSLILNIIILYGTRFSTQLASISAVFSNLHSLFLHRPLYLCLDYFPQSPQRDSTWQLYAPGRS